MTSPAATTQIPEITAQITVALAEPETVINRLALYDSAEAKNRHTEYNLSILSYALAGYISANLEIPDKYEVQVTPLDDAVVIAAQNKNPKRATKDRFQQEVPYPVWLASFFEDDSAFAYLEPTDTTPLSDVLDALAEHVAALPDDEDTTASDDPESEDNEDWDDDEDDEDDEDEEDSGEEDSPDADEDDEPAVSDEEQDLTKM